MASRVPVPDGSVVDLVVELGKDVTAEEVNQAMKDAAATPGMKDVLLYSDFKWVSSDVVGNPYSSIFDPEYTRVIGKRIVKVLSWYDNEWGYSNRVVDLIRLFKKMDNK
jgi:glyceraldehyde 3-phosphate dehydrogenase